MDTGILLKQIDIDLATVVDQARRSLVEISNGRRGHGAGTIWHPDGLIVTNAHVVHVQSPKVTLPDGRELPARLLAHDPGLDVAALKVDASDLSTVTLGESTRLRAGEWVLALGHPWGVEGAATGGIVIGVGSDWPELPRPDRDASRVARSHAGGEWLVASLHLRPGHSGGPMVDAHGRLVGINTMMAGPGVGVAVPVHVVKRFLHQKLNDRAL
jgi:serine protease Do